MTDHIPIRCSSEQRQRFDAAPPMIIDTAKTYAATMVTSKARSRSCSTHWARGHGHSFVYWHVGTTTTVWSFTA